MSKSHYNVKRKNINIKSSVHNQKIKINPAKIEKQNSVIADNRLIINSSQW